MTVLLLCYYSIAPFTFKGSVSAWAICHLDVFEVVECNLELTYQSSSGLFSVTEFTVFGFEKIPTVSLDSNNNDSNNKDVYHTEIDL